MIKKILSTIMVAVAMIATAGLAVPALDVQAAADICGKSGADAAAKEAAGCNDSNSVDSVVKKILAVMYWAVIVLAVIVIIVGGFMYVTSGGDPGKTAKAKVTIAVAVIGLVIAILASAIINFVIDSLT